MQQKPRKDKTAALSYKPTPIEQPLYEALFLLSDRKKAGGTVNFQDALETLCLSKLSKDVVEMIINMAQDDNYNQLNRGQFYVAVRLVQLRQNGASVKNLTLTVPPNVHLDPPYFKGISGSELKIGKDVHSSDMCCSRCLAKEKELEKLREELNATMDHLNRLKQELTIVRSQAQIRKAERGMNESKYGYEERENQGQLLEHFPPHRIHPETNDKMGLSTSERCHSTHRNLTQENGRYKYLTKVELKIDEHENGADYSLFKSQPNQVLPRNRSVPNSLVSDNEDAKRLEDVNFYPKNGNISPQPPNPISPNITISNQQIPTRQGLSKTPQYQNKLHNQANEVSETKRPMCGSERSTRFTSSRPSSERTMPMNRNSYLGTNTHFTGTTILQTHTETSHNPSHQSEIPKDAMNLRRDTVNSIVSDVTNITQINPKPEEKKSRTDNVIDNMHELESNNFTNRNKDSNGQRNINNIRTQTTNQKGGNKDVKSKPRKLLSFMNADNTKNKALRRFSSSMQKKSSSG